MRVGIPRERAANERRVAIVPATAATLRDWGWDVDVERAAGVAAGFPNDAYEASGATIVDRVAGLDVLACVGPPATELLDAVSDGGIVVGFLEPYTNENLMRSMGERRLTALAVEAMPRTTLAQSMDALSSQANLAGYAAVLAAAQASPKLLPMMVTAAGTIAPARVLILGVGVAGLQAIATAKRLGAVVHAYDIRTDTKEQVESLGARFVEAPTAASDDAGYATEVTEDTQAAQHAALAPFVADADIVVTTALIPGRPAPLLVTDDMIESMHPGAVIFDMAAATGGNVSMTRPDEVVVHNGVAIHGPTSLVSLVAADASRMYSRNLQNLLERMRATEDGRVDIEDEILGGCAVMHAGEARNDRTKALLGAHP